MSNILLGLIVVCLCLLILKIFGSNNCSKNKSQCPCGRPNGCNCKRSCKRPELLVLDTERSDVSMKSLNDLEYDTLYRGMAPRVDCPNHINGRWMADYSHVAADHLDRPNLSSAYDVETRLVSRSANLNLCDNSNMHLTSRFATERSQ